MGSNNSSNGGRPGTRESQGSNSNNSSPGSSRRLSSSLGSHPSTLSSHFRTRRDRPGEIMDYDSSESDSVESRGAQDLISVFQILIRNGQIHIMSSEDDSSDENYSQEHKPKAPRSDYEVDQSIIEKNDISLIMRNGAALTSKRKRSFPQFLASREMGNMSTLSGFDRSHRNYLSSHFLPNTVRKVANYGYKAFCGTYSKSGDIFLSASQDRAIRIYDTTKNHFKKFKKIMARDVGWSVLDTAFSPDGRYVVYSSWSECIHICNIYGEVERHESLCLCPDNRRFCIFSLAFSEDGNEILGGANDGFLYIYNRESNQRVLKIEAHDNDVNSVAFADSSSNILFSAADDGLCKVWDRRTLRESDPLPVGVLAGHIDGITYIDSKGDGRYLLTNSKDQSIKLWDMRVFASANAIANSKRLVADQNWDYRWQRVPKRLCVSRKPAEGDVSVMTYRGHSVLNTLIRCHFSPTYSTGQRYVYTGCAAGRVVIYDLLTGKIEKILKGHRTCVRDVSWHPYRSEIVSTSWDNTIGLWTYENNHSLESDEEMISEIEANSDPPPKKISLRRSSRLAEKNRLRVQTIDCPDNQDGDVI